MNRLSLTALALATLAFGATAIAAPVRSGLTEAQVADLPPSAREQYTEAMRAVDFVRYQDAVDALLEAASRAPESVELNLLAAEAAGRWAETGSYGDASRRYYRDAIDALERIQNEEMGGTNRAQVADMLNRYRDAVGAVGARDDARMATGFRLVQTVRRERLQRAVRDSDEGARVLLGREERTQEHGDEFYEERAGEIWPQFAAPARYVPPRFRPDQMGGQFGAPGMYGPGGMGMGMYADPAMMGGMYGDPGMGPGMYGGGGGMGDPFAPGQDPFATGQDPFGGQGQQGGFGADPFAPGGGGGFGADPFGGGGGQPQYGPAQGQNPFVDEGGK